MQIPMNLDFDTVNLKSVEFQAVDPIVKKSCEKSVNNSVNTFQNSAKNKDAFLLETFLLSYKITHTSFQYTCAGIQ